MTRTKAKAALAGAASENDFRSSNVVLRNSKSRPTTQGETAIGYALRRALERQSPTREQRDFDREWSLRPVDGGDR